MVGFRSGDYNMTKRLMIDVNNFVEAVMNNDTNICGHLAFPTQVNHEARYNTSNGTALNFLNKHGRYVDHKMTPDLISTFMEKMIEQQTKNAPISERVHLYKIGYQLGMSNKLMAKTGAELPKQQDDDSISKTSITLIITASIIAFFALTFCIYKGIKAKNSSKATNTTQIKVAGTSDVNDPEDTQESMIQSAAN